MFFSKNKEKEKNMENGTLHEKLHEQNKETGQPSDTKNFSQNANSNYGEIGPLAGIIIVLLILTGGALYFFVNEIQDISKQGSEIQNILEEKDLILEKLKKQSNSDKIKDIKKDLEETPIENLDKGIENIKERLNISSI